MEEGGCDPNVTSASTSGGSAELSRSTHATPPRLCAINTTGPAAFSTLFPDERKDCENHATGRAGCPLSALRSRRWPIPPATQHSCTERFSISDKKVPSPANAPPQSSVIGGKARTKFRGRPPGTRFRSHGGVTRPQRPARLQRSRRAIRLPPPTARMPSRTIGVGMTVAHAVPHRSATPARVSNIVASILGT